MTHDCQFDGPVPDPDALDAAALEPRRRQPPVAGDELDDAVRIVEDAIDATSDEWTDEDGRRVSSPSDRTGRAVVDALLEAGWQRPRPGPDLTPRDVARYLDVPVMLCRPGTCPKCDRLRAGS